jgi:hypothetical protein
VPLFDRIVSLVMLLGLGGLIAARAFRAWADYRVQRRAVDLLVRSVTESEKQPKPRERRR